MESLHIQRLIFIFAFFFIVNNPVNSFDIYLSPDPSPTSQPGSDNKLRSSGIYFSYPPKSDSISLYGGTDNQQSLHSISSGLSASTKNNDDGFSDTQISKPVIHSVLRARKGGNAANPELKKICGKTENPALCISTVAPRLSGGGGASIRAVLEVAIRASYELAKVGKAKAKKLAMTSHGSEDIKDCKGSFDDALSNFDLALKALQKRDVGTMNSMLSDVVTSMSDCDDSLGTGSPLTNIGDKLANMTSNCLGIISQMH